VLPNEKNVKDKPNREEVSDKISERRSSSLKTKLVDWPYNQTGKFVGIDYRMEH